eukprot:TRINITY_DN2059_c0_g1_i3.p1 TRINITY_DN2059_c0_g1~~TRINITY_DN2059_c0_g1_i3.p1  ORF type:complete len:315 (+),score=60.53 TRINITY_DN2059_c0_g1_i3:412-1356(+)
MMQSGGSNASKSETQNTQSQQQQSQQWTSSNQMQSTDEVRTLWVGDLQYWMDENYLQTCFAHTGEVVSTKIIRNKQTLQPEGYGFVEFVSRASAEKVLQSYNGAPMPNAQQSFRLNWATFGASERRAEAAVGGYSIFVGDLAPEVDDAMLQETFQSRYPSFKGAKVVIDANTGRSKGYGFVRFGDEAEKNRAMVEMNGAYCSSRPMRINEATPKKSLGFQQSYSGKGNYYNQYGMMGNQGFLSDTDPNNTTIFVGGLDPNASDEDLRQVFGPFGDIVYVKIPVGKGCGFVQFTNRFEVVHIFCFDPNFYLVPML